MKQKGRIRLIYAATAVAVLAMAGGFVMASVLTSTSVTQTANFYQGGSTPANGYGQPTLTVSTTPSGTVACSGSSVTMGATGSTTKIVLSNTSGGTACTAGNFAEEFTFAFSASLTTAQTDTITVTTEGPGFAVGTNSVSVTSGTGTTYTQTIDVYVDYNAVNPPAGGITVLDVVVQ